MRVAVWSLLLATAVLPLGGAASAQHSPRLSDGSELGSELVLADNLISLAAVFQKPLGPTTDARLGIGLADPDNSDSDRFVRVGLRAFIGSGSRRFPFDKAIGGELDSTLGEDRFRLPAGRHSDTPAAGAEGSSPTYSRCSSTRTTPARPTSSWRCGWEPTIRWAGSPSCAATWS